MYIPKHFEQTDEGALWDFIDEHAFGTLITTVDGAPFASHLPFLRDSVARTLHCHVARASPHWQQLAGSGRALVIFAGPHGYISPTWYVDPGVPTWNYAVVHVMGEARSVDDPAHMRRHVEALAAKFESGRVAAWVPDYDPRRLTAIVGIEIRVGKLEGKFKLGQNRSVADRAGVMTQLAASGSDNDEALARLMAAWVPRS